MRVLTSQECILSSYFDEIKEGKIVNTTMKERLIDNHTIQVKEKENFR